MPDITSNLMEDPDDSLSPSADLMPEFSEPDNEFMASPVPPRPQAVLPPVPPPPVTRREFGDVLSVRQNIYDSVLRAATEMPPLSNKTHTLSLRDVHYLDPGTHSLAEQKKAILTGNSLGRRLTGTWDLADNTTGAVIDSRKQVIGSVPHYTDRGTFINNGTEYALRNQQRLRSGIFTRVKDNGEIESHANMLPGKGMSHRYFLEPEKGVLFVTVGAAKMPLLPLMTAMGATPDQLKEAWGEKLYNANYSQNTGNALSKLAAKFLPEKDRPTEPADIRNALAARFQTMELDPEVTKRTLGREHTHLTLDALLDTTKKLIGVSKGEVEPDDRDALPYQRILGPEDLFAERISRDYGAFRKQLLWKATSKGNLSSMPSSALKRQIESVLLHSGLGNAMEEINSAEILDKHYAVSRMGEGGIPSDDAIPDDSRSVQSSHFGFIDPLRTPESSRAGVDLYMSSGSRKGSDGKLYGEYTDKTGQPVWKTPQDTADMVVGFPGSFASKDEYVPAMVRGKEAWAKRDELDIELPRFERAFSPLANLIPLISMVKGQRVAMASRMSTQALPLVNAEAPLVQSAVPGTGSMRSYEREYASKMGAKRADKPGRVMDVTPDGIKVQYNDNTEETIELYNNLPFNRKTFLHQTPVVQPGDAFDTDTLLARSNFTDKSGDTALGANFRTAYIPWQGKNFEDAIVISRSAAEKLSSEHMYQHQLDTDDKTKVGFKEFVSVFPGKFDRKTLDKLDRNGLIRVGETVNYGDPLVLAVRQNENAYNKVHKQKQSGYGDATITWDHHDAGVVTDVVEGKKGPVVVVKAISKMQVGDKLSGRMGDKGVVADIIDDEQMPHDGEGNPFEVLLSPLGITSRTNPSQLVELALGKIAAKTGKPEIVEDWQDINYAEYAKERLGRAGLSLLDDIYDPTQNRKIRQINTGSRFLMKLHHSSEGKAQGRSGGSYSAEDAPSKSGDSSSNSKRNSLLDTNALLSHGAVANLRDIGAVRGQRNDEYWMQFMQGHSPQVKSVPTAYKKFVAQLQASGINVTRSGTQTNIMALTDKDIDMLAGDRNIESSDGVDWKNQLKPLKGGLFDPQITGGHGSSRWAAIKLTEPMPNPVMEEPIRRVLGLTKQQFEDTIAGKHELPGTGTGPTAIAKALKAIDLDKDIALSRVSIQSGNAGEKDKAIRKLGYLKSAKRLDIHPGDWVLSRAPVLPTTFRPVSLMTNSTPLISDVNYLYKELIESNKGLASMKDVLEDNALGDERLAVYHAFKGVTGLGDPTTQKNQEKNVKGILKSVFGSAPKHSSVQRKLLSNTVDNVGRAVITPNPDLDMDSIGIPEDKAFDVYTKFVVRRLRREGMPVLAALQQIKDRSKLAKEALLEEMEERPVYANRAPVLHKFGIMAFRPVLVQGHTMQLSPLVVKGAGADFDGNCVDFDTEISLVLDVVRIESHTEGVLFLNTLGDVVMRLTQNTLLTFTQNGIVRVTIPIGEFPRTGKPKKDKNGALVYEVPPGVSIATYDHATGKVYDAEVTHFTAENSHEVVTVKTYRGREVCVSDNESLAVFDTKTAGFIKRSPLGAENQLVAFVKEQPIPGTEFDRDLGWWYGAAAADGWLQERTVGYSKLDDTCRSEFERIARRINPNFSSNEYIQPKTADKYSNSAKLHLNGQQLRQAVFSIYRDRGAGRGALYKTIPQEILSRGSRECLLGVLSGLLDGDRTLGWNTFTGKARAICKFNTSSKAFRDSLIQLCRYLGIRCSLSVSPARGKSAEAYIVMPALADIYRLLPEITSVSSAAKTWMSQFSEAQPEDNAIDIVPISLSLAKALQDAFLPINATRYTCFAKAKKTGYVGKFTATQLFEGLPAGFDHPHLVGFKLATFNDAVHWDRIKTVTRESARPVFDLAVPGTQVFMISNGLIIYDTMNFHVPTSNAANKEALEKMLPSRSLLSPANFKSPVHAPTKDYVSGLFYATGDKSKKPKKYFHSLADARKAYQRGEIAMNDEIEVLD